MRPADLDDEDDLRCARGAGITAALSLALAGLVLVALALLSGCACGHERTASGLAVDASQLAEVAEILQRRPLTPAEAEALRAKELGLRAQALALEASAEEAPPR